jgi:hypothetical protein
MNCIVANIGNDDVLLGRGTGPNAHEGNKRFRVLSAHMLKNLTITKCAASERNSKLTMAKKLVDTVHTRNGKFVRKLTRDERNSVVNELFEPSASTRRLLKKNKNIDLYFIVPEDMAIEKAKQSFRHQLRVMSDGTDHINTNWGGRHAPALLFAEESHATARADDESASSSMKHERESGEVCDPMLLSTSIRSSIPVSLGARRKSKFQETLHASRLKQSTADSASQQWTGVDSYQPTNTYLVASNVAQSSIQLYQIPEVLGLNFLEHCQNLTRRSHHHIEDSGKKRQTIIDPGTPLNAPPPLFLANIPYARKRAGFTDRIHKLSAPCLLTPPSALMMKWPFGSVRDGEPRRGRLSLPRPHPHGMRALVKSRTLLSIAGAGEISLIDTLSALLQLKNSSVPFIGSEPHQQFRR